MDDPNTENVDGLENYGIMFLSGGLLLAVVPFIAYFMPETSGKELDEIQQLFIPQDRSPLRTVEASFKAFFSDNVDLHPMPEASGKELDDIQQPFIPQAHSDGK